MAWTAPDYAGKRVFKCFLYFGAYCSAVSDMYGRLCLLGGSRLGEQRVSFHECVGRLQRTPGAPVHCSVQVPHKGRLPWPWHDACVQAAKQQLPFAPQGMKLVVAHTCNKGPNSSPSPKPRALPPRP